MTRTFVVVCEAEADQQTACELADRVFLEKLDWLEPEYLTSVRQWRGLEESQRYTPWKAIPRLARERSIKAFGHFGGEPAAFDAHVARQALLLIKLSKPAVHGVLLIRDADDQPERRRGLEQARNLGVLTVPIVIGFAVTKRECWVLAGFEPCNDEEQGRFQTIVKELGLDPSARAEALTAKDHRAKRSAKRVLADLCGGDKDREAECWRSTALTVLEQRGNSTGLAEYLDEVRQRLVPLFRQSGP